MHTTQNQAIRCIIFDWDGTLIDSIKPLIVAFNQTCDELSLARPDQDRLRKSFGNHSQTILKQLMAPSMEAKEFESFVITFEKLFFEHYRSLHPILIENTKPTLVELKNQGYHICIATNAPRPVLLRGLKATGTMDLFDFTASADEFPPKPSPLMLEKCAIMTETLPENCLMVGDHYNDILAGQAASMQTIGVLTGSQDRQGLSAHQPSDILPSAAELTNWLDKR
ncbi:MAG: HAD family hydrolase [Pseudomonadota bacterium]|nr:HAD family hydrolase [Pseudomonadota bacterium]MEC8383202.1 HAD family hydrolase [Pseudomonadota bacterium]